MATLRNKRKLAAVTRETQEEHPRNGQSWNTSVPRINEEYITELFEEIEGRVSKKLSQEFSRTESHTLGALSKLDEFLLNPQITTHSGTVPGTFRNTNVENQGTNEDDFQSDPHPEAGIFRGQTTQNSGPKDCRDMVTGVQGEIRNGHHSPKISIKIDYKNFQGRQQCEVSTIFFQLGCAFGCSRWQLDFFVHVSQKQLSSHRKVLLRTRWS